MTADKRFLKTIKSNSSPHMNKSGDISNPSAFNDVLQQTFFINNNQEGFLHLNIKDHQKSIIEQYSLSIQGFPVLGTDDSIAQLTLQTQLTDEFLMMTDRFSMAHSVEARTPFLDHDLVSLLFSIPIEQRVNYSDYKMLLKKSVGHLLPSSVLSAKKHGFNIPLSLWMRGKMRDMVEDYIGASALQKSHYIKPTFYSHYVKPMLEGDNRYIVLIWSVLMFQIWHKLYLRQFNQSANFESYA